MPVLALCTDMQQDSNVYLIEDGLALWLACVENATEMTDELMQLFQNMPPLIGNKSNDIFSSDYVCDLLYSVLTIVWLFFRIHYRKSSYLSHNHTSICAFVSRMLF